MSLMLRDEHRVFVYSEYVDLRAGFDRLSMLVRERMAANLLEGDLFVFLGNSRRKCKAICFDGSGVVLINKRLEHGHFMRLSQLEACGGGEITTAEFQALFHGGVIVRSQFGSSFLTKAHGETKFSRNEATR